MRTDTTIEHRPVELRCMEIWGGSARTEQAVSVPGIDVYVRSQTYKGNDRGGDLYYVSQCGLGNIARFVLADVSGHGAEASGVAAMLARLMRKHINTPDQTALARAMNHEFDALDREGRFATAVLATYFAPSDELILVNAGHPPPLHFSAQAGSWSFVTDDAPARTDVGVPNLPLGVIEPTPYTQTAVRLAPGDVVVLYTDAFCEACDADRVQLGPQGLLRVVERCDAHEPGSLCGRIFDELDAYRGGMPAGDDQTAIVLHHNGAPGRARRVGDRVGAVARLLGLRPHMRDDGVG